MTGYLTSITMRNRPDGGGIRPRLPSRFEHAGWTGTAVRAVHPARSTEYPDRLLSRYSRQPGAAREDTEFREITGFPEPVPQPAVRGLPAFTVPFLPAARFRAMVPDTVTKDYDTRGIPPERHAAETSVPQKVPPGEKTIDREGRTGGNTPPERRWPETLKTRPVKDLSRPETAAPRDQTETAPEEKRTGTATGKTRSAATLRADGRIPLPARPSRMMSDPVPAGRVPERTVTRTHPASRKDDVTAVSGKTLPDRIRPGVQVKEDGRRKMVVPEPRIQVTIGRIEVRSVPAREERENRGKMPELDLAEYLEQPKGRVTR